MDPDANTAMSSQQTFGQRVRQQRHRLRLTQAELAERVGCSEITVRKIESGERTPSQQIAELLARSLEIAADERDAFLDCARGQPAARQTPRHPPLSLARLPAPITRLLGRDTDVATVCRRLQDTGVRLVTLVGPPGIGKTRLSLQVAASLQGHFADGVVFVPLAPVGEPELVLDTIGQALGVTEATGEPLFDSLCALLEGYRLLLVLDNFEHVLPAAGDLARLLEACPQLTVLATSRAALLVRGEQVVPLAPLALPALTWPLEPEAVVRAPAVELFVERARAVAPHFALTTDNVAAVAAICARLDGLPLAIELAAARTRLLAPLALLERLGQKYLLHGAGPRDLPPRHQTLHNAIAWSYNLLTPAEQRLFARLGVFIGEYDLAAVEAVCGDDEFSGVLELLGALADHSLVRVAEGPGGAMRIGMLETIREFALERLGESGELAAMRVRYARHYLELAARADGELNGPEQERWLDRLEREHDHFRAVLAWATHGERFGEAGAPDGGMARLPGWQLAARLWRFWYTRCHLNEGRRWLAALLATDQDDAPSPEHARLLLGAGVLARAQGDLDEGRRLIDASLDGARRDGLPADVALALYHRGVAAFDGGEAGAAIRDLEECLAIQRQQGDVAGIASTLNGLGSVLIGHDDERAVALLDESVRRQRALGNRRGEAFTLHSLGLAELRRNNHAAAASHFQQGLALFRSLGDDIGIADCLAGLAAVAGAQAQRDRAGQLWRAAEALRERIAAPLATAERDVYMRYLGGITALPAAPEDPVEELVARILAVDRYPTPSAAGATSCHA